MKVIQVKYSLNWWEDFITKRREQVCTHKYYYLDFITIILILITPIIITKIEHSNICYKTRNLLSVSKENTTEVCILIFNSFTTKLFILVEKIWTKTFLNARNQVLSLKSIIISV